MKTSLKMLLGAVCLGVIVLFTGATEIKPNRTHAWEYTILAPGGDLKAGMNALGQEGWELVTATHSDQQSRMLYFKRPTDKR